MNEGAPSGNASRGHELMDMPRCLGAVAKALENIERALRCVVDVELVEHASPGQIDAVAELVGLVGKKADTRRVGSQVDLLQNDLICGEAPHRTLEKLP